MCDRPGRIDPQALELHKTHQKGEVKGAFATVSGRQDVRDQAGFGLNAPNATIA
jgi:hypothetical protein